MTEGADVTLGFYSSHQVKDIEENNEVHSGLHMAPRDKELPMQERQRRGSTSGGEDPLETAEQPTPDPAWEVPRTAETGLLQSTGCEELDTGYDSTGMHVVVKMLLIRSS